MAPRLSWPTELRRIILKDALDCYRRCAHREKEGNGLQELSKEDFLPLPESIKNSNDEIAKEIHEELKNQILYLFKEAFGKFEKTKSNFFKMKIDERFSDGLHKTDTLFKKLVDNQISESDFKEEYENEYKELKRLIVKDYRELFKSYYDGCCFLFKQFKSSSPNLAGYLSIYYALKSRLSDLWVKPKDGSFIRFYKYCKVGDKPIQLLFCDYLFKGINFFPKDYSYLDIFKHSKPLELDTDSFYEIQEYFRTGKEELLGTITSNIVKKICSKESTFKGEGGPLTLFFKQLINTLKKIYSTQPGEPIDVSVDELGDLYNFLVLQNGILEYEVFRVAANSGHACLPKISVITYEGGSHEEREVDLLILGDYKLFLIEVSFGRDAEKYQEKLDIIIDRLGEIVSGFSFEKYIVTRDNFEYFINSLSKQFL